MNALLKISKSTIAFAVYFILSSIWGSNLNAQESYKLNYQGSSTVGNFIFDADVVLTNTTFTVNTKPESSGGELAILEGRTDIAGIARVPNNEVLSSGINSTLIGWDAIAIIVNKDNPIKNLTQSQLKSIYLGEVTNWRELGGLDVPIKPYIVGQESATRKVCRSIILGKEDYNTFEEVSPDQDIIQRVQNNAGGIGHLSFSFIINNSEVKSLSINGQTLTNNNYPITRPLYLLWWPGRKDVAQFIDWATSSEGQRIVTKRFIGINEAETTTSDEMGELVVFTKTTPVEDGGIFYYPHNQYQILHLDRTLLITVPNHLSNNDETPTRINLPKGNYIIKTNLNSQEEQEIHVNIPAGKLTKIYPDKLNNKNNSGEDSNVLKEIKKTESLQSDNNKSFDFFGDFRVRGEQDNTSTLNRFRGRFRIRAGMHAQLNPKAKLEVRLISTSNPNNPNSSHVNLDGGFNQIRVAFDRAFFHYHSNEILDFNWWIGKFSNPTLSSQIFSEVLWDADIQPEGSAFALSKMVRNGQDKLRLTNGFYLLSEFNADQRKNWLYNAQISDEIKFADKVTLTVASGLSYYANIKGLPISSDFLDSNEGNRTYDQINVDHNQDTTVTTHYSSDFVLLDNFINVKTILNDNPLIFKVHWIHNLGSDTDNNGYSVGLSYGQLRDDKDWLFYYQFNRLQQESVFTPYVQDDALHRTNTTGHVIGIAHNVLKKISVQLWALLDTPKDSDNLESRVRLDLNLKF